MTSKLQSTKKKVLKPKVDTENKNNEMLYAFKEIPVSQAYLDRLIEDLKKWAEANPEEKFITKFYLSKGLTRDAYNKIVSRHPDVKEAHQEVMQLLGERMISRAIDRKSDWLPTRWLIHNYSQEFRDNNTYHADLASKDTQQAAAPIVVIERMPDTTVVKKKEKNG